MGNTKYRMRESEKGFTTRSLQQCRRNIRGGGMYPKQPPASASTGCRTRMSICAPACASAEEKDTPLPLLPSPSQPNPPSLMPHHLAPERSIEKGEEKSGQMARVSAADSTRRHRERERRFRMLRWYLIFLHDLFPLLLYRP